MKNIRTAVIDVGTLKCKFEICEFDEKLNIKTLYKDKQLTVLGRDLDKNDNRILEKSILKTVEALKDFKDKIKSFSVDSYKAVTTEAIRKAINSEEVLDRIEDETGIRLQTLSQEEEAEIYFRSVSKDFPDQVIAVTDIGGGSVQVVIGKDTEIYDSYLFKTGTYFLQEMFSKGSLEHLTSEEELSSTKDYVRSSMNKLSDCKHKPELLVYGSSNIINFMMAMKVSLIRRTNNGAHPYQTNVDALIPVYEKIIRFCYEDRMKMYPEEPYYMWSADRALLNIFQIADSLRLKIVVPSNNNISTGILCDLARDAMNQ